MERFIRLFQFYLISAFLHLFILIYFLFPNSILSSEKIASNSQQNSLESFEVISSTSHFKNIKTKQSLPPKISKGLPEQSVNLENGDGQIVAPKLLRSYPIQYPEGARQRSQEGQVVALLSLDAGGRVQGVEVLSASDPEFIRSVREGLQLYQFAPATRRGVPIPIQIKYIYRFHLSPK